MAGKLDYRIGPIDSFIKENWSPTIIVYSESESLNQEDGIYVGFVDIDTLPDLILRISIQRDVPYELVSQIVFLAHQFIFRQLGFHTDEIQASVLEDADNLLAWQTKFASIIEAFDKTSEFTVADIFIKIVLGFDPRKNKLEATETNLLEIIDLEKEE